MPAQDLKRLSKRDGAALPADCQGEILRGGHGDFILRTCPTCVQNLHLETFNGAKETVLADHPEVDVVLTWVDDSDAQWAKLRDAYADDSDTTTDASGASSEKLESEETASLRFRDWGLLRYWFRGVEANMPWVRNVYLVTENPVPAWLNTAHPQLRVLRHRDFIPAEYLPTFNSRSIEFNLHRIEGLSETFVYFNDDMFPLSPISKDHFFVGNRPRAFAILNALSVDDSISHAMLNNVGVLNKHFSKMSVIRKALLKWFTPHYGIKNLQNIALLPWKKFTGFHNAHLPQPMRRSDAQALWSEEFQKLDSTSRSRFRAHDNLNPYLITWWAVCRGQFEPASLRGHGRYFQIAGNNFDQVLPIVSGGHTPVLCINDGQVPRFNEAKARLIDAFESRFPEKSAYEL